MKGIFPPIVNPAAIPIIFASATPTCINLLGFSSANSFIFKEPVKSAHNATTLLLFLPSSVRPSPKPDLVSLSPVLVKFSIFNNHLKFQDFVKELYLVVHHLELHHAIYVYAS